MKIKVIILDDELAAVHTLQSYLKEIKTLDIALATTNSLEVVEFVKEQEVEIVFMGIEMPKLTGIEIAQLLPSKIHIVFVTAYSHFALDSFNYNVLDYLVKPFDFSRVMQTVNKYEALMKRVQKINGTTQDDFIVIKGDSKGKFVKINLDELDIIMSEGQYQTLYVNNKKYVTVTTAKQIEAYLPKSIFIRVHRSFIVAAKKNYSLRR